jgi:putative ABC transport system ATP-binding protein
MNGDGSGRGSGNGDESESGNGSGSGSAPNVGNVVGAGAAAPDVETVSGTDPEVPTLELRRVHKEYETGAGTVVALDDVDFAVRPGEFVAVVGPSGCGKSTLLNVLGLLDTPTSGLRLLRGRDVTALDDEARTRARKDAVGFVFQDFFLIPSLTATENVELPTLFGDDPTATERARELLTRVGLGDRLDHTPNELSGGQKQRVAIARALINRPAVVLADEPTGNLDSDTGAQVLSEFRRICETGVSVVAVTHDDLVTGYADRTVELIDGRLGEAGR